METPRSYVIFADGTEEDILYFERNAFGDMLFSTKEGIYKYSDKLNGRKVVQKTSVNGTYSTVNIDHIVLDDRVLYRYTYNYTLADFKILADKNATEEEILVLIAKNLGVTYWRD